MNDTTIKWQTPPQSKTQRGKWDATADALRERPGDWALVAEGVDTSNLARHIADARVKSFEPARAFEATSRHRPDGTYDIYARFVGGPR